jgi:hypothetical protein
MQEGLQRCGRSLVEPLIRLWMTEFSAFSCQAPTAPRNHARALPPWGYRLGCSRFREKNGSAPIERRGQVTWKHGASF